MARRHRIGTLLAALLILLAVLLPAVALPRMSSLSTAETVTVDVGAEHLSVTTAPSALSGAVTELGEYTLSGLTTPAGEQTLHLHSERLIGRRSGTPVLAADSDPAHYSPPVMTATLGDRQVTGDAAPTGHYVLWAGGMDKKSYYLVDPLTADLVLLDFTGAEERGRSDIFHYAGSTTDLPLRPELATLLDLPDARVSRTLELSVEPATGTLLGATVATTLTAGDTVVVSTSGGTDPAAQQAAWEAAAAAHQRMILWGRWLPLALSLSGLGVLAWTWGPLLRRVVTHRAQLLAPQ